MKDRTLNRLAGMATGGLLTAILGVGLAIVGMLQHDYLLYSFALGVMIAGGSFFASPFIIVVVDAFRKRDKP